MLKGNKGDWSELYVFAKLLADGKLFQSDINLEKNENDFYEVVKAFREGSDIIEYDRNKEVRVYRITNNSKELLGELKLEYLEEQAKLLYKGIVSGKGKSFEIPDSQTFIDKAHIQKLTALVTSKSDIKLRIYDHRLAKEADLGFSIKSLIGQDSTLFNTGPGNNFIYEIKTGMRIDINAFNKETYKPEGRTSKLTARLNKLKNDLKLKVEYSDIQSKQLMMNLEMIDGNLQKVIGSALLYRWLYKESSLRKVAELLEEKDPLNFYKGEKSDQKMYEYKLKKFLVDCAMGMTSETPWHGEYDTTGGVIIAKKDGNIVCFHVYNFNLFREYLINNTMFEQPSTGEDEDNPGNPRVAKKGDKSKPKNYYYGWLYKEEEKYKMKINLQVRFI